MYKRIPKIESMEIKKLSCTQDMTGEYSSNVNIDFILEEKCSFKIFKKEYEIDRVKMIVSWEQLKLSFANNNEEFRDFSVPKSYLSQILKFVENEEENGRLKGWSFSEELYEMLTSDEDYRFY